MKTRIIFVITSIFFVSIVFGQTTRNESYLPLTLDSFTAKKQAGKAANY